jgi:hypothetical protein
MNPLPSLAAAFLLACAGAPVLSAQLLAQPSAVSTGEREMKALAEAWPERLSRAELRDGDWMVSVDDTWFAWAHGRLLPEADAGRWEEFAPVPFYLYPPSLPPVPVLDEPAAERLRGLVRQRRTVPRSEEFLDALLHARHRAGIESHLVTVDIVGFPVRVHELLAGPLAGVTAALETLRTMDPEVDAFLSGLAEMTGYNYRNVEGTPSRSLHSYGLAIDMVPRSYHGGETYWLWATRRSPDWWTIPYEKRWMPPRAVIEAFESQGFVWGGKWIFFDTMHFEYRPEILLLSRENAPGSPAAGTAVPSPH